MLAVDSIQWADGFLLVYSILDKASFDYIQRFRRHVLEIRNISNSKTDQHQQTAIPCVLVANKADMVHLRQVPTHEGIYLFFLLSSSKNYYVQSFAHDPNDCSSVKKKMTLLQS